MIPKKSEINSIKSDILPETETDQAIRKFVQLKAQMNEFSSRLESAEVEATGEALSIFQYNQKHNKNNTVYSDSMAKVVLCFRQKYANSKDSVKLARLEDDIRIEEIKLQRKNATKLNKLDADIEELENQIKALEERKQKLLESKHLSNLQAQHQKVIQESAYKVPGLVVHFNK
ncbi:hypothetical protein [Lyngbya sp. PCC 8106]|uniref:hypothetical protein n=1 Tax=Lyngbya sp. (strain PCC 8106) TaxID=313612 RepID=UPI0000EAB9FC|nr:hypothetical protein [Lyngbya sp. PCC 8106]EAW33350.1 hypothetical protein L8106_22811 [Lyngbya sp. PCC 8106]